MTDQHQEVEAAMAALEEIEGRPVEEHPEVFDRVHARLRRALEETPAAPAEPS